MKKFISIFAIVMALFVNMNVAFAQYVGDYNISQYEASDRTDAISLDLSYSHNGIYGCGDNLTKNGFSVGASIYHAYIDCVFQYPTNIGGSDVFYGFHIGGNFAMTDVFSHTFTITPAVGVYFLTDDTSILDYGVVWKYSHKNSVIGFVFKTYTQSGVSAGLTFNFGKTKAKKYI